MHAKYARLIPRPRASPQAEADGRPKGPNMWQKVTAWIAKFPPLLKRIPVKKMFPFVLAILVILAVATLVYWLISRWGEKIDDHDFTRGVLAVNTSQSVYAPGDTVLLQMASLDSQGDTLCHSNLRLEVSIPGAKQPTILTTKANQIITSTTCGDNNVTNEPDYITRIQVNKLGAYKVKLINQDTGKKVVSSFSVQESDPGIQIERSGATRINPFKSDRYPMVIMLKTQQDFEGKIIERIPKSFSLIWQGPSVVEEKGDYKTVTWDVSLKAGESKKLAYEYTAPQVSPEFYTLGRISVRDTSGRSIYEEQAQWQIASDFACTSNLSGGTGNWATAGTWSNCNSTTPQTTDSVTITAGDTVTMNASPTITFITINGTLSPDASTRTLTLTNTTTSQTTLAFGASGSISTANASTVVLSANASWTTTPIITGNLSAYNLTFSPTVGGDRTYTLGTGNWTIANDFTVNPSASNASRDLFVLMASSGTNTITVTGTTTLTASGSNPGTGSFSTNSNSGNTLSSGYISIASRGVLLGTTGTIKVTGTTGDLITNTGTFTEATSTIRVSPSGAGSPDVFSGAETVYILEIDAASATIVNAGADITTNNTAGNKLYVKAGVFNQEARTITAGTAGTLQVDDNGTLCLGGTTASTSADCASGATQTTTQPLPSFTTYTFSSGSTVRYLSDAATTISNTPTYGNLEFKPKMQGSDRIYTSAGALTVNGNLTIIPTTNYGVLYFNPAGDLTIGSTKTTTISSTGSALSRYQLKPSSTNYNLSTGFLIVSGYGRLDATSATSTVTLTGTSGTLFTLSGNGQYIITSGTPTISVTSASGPVQLFSSAFSIYNLTVNSSSSSTVVNSGATPTFASGGSLTVTSGVLNFDTGVTGPGASGTLTVGSSGTLCLGGTAAATNTSVTCNTGATSTSAIAMPTFNAYSLNASSKVIYLSNAATTVSNTPTYGNLYLQPVLTADRTYIMGGAMTINGDLDIIPSGSANTLLVNLGGTTTLGATKTVYVRRSGSNALSNLDAVNGSNYNLSSGFVNIGTGGTYTARASTITLTGITGTLLSNSGTFTQGTSTVTATSASGTPTLLGGTSSTTFATLTLNSAATVINGGNAFTIDTNMNVSQGVFNASTQVTGSESGTLTVSSGATLCLGGGATNTTATCDSVATSTSAITMPTFQTYTFTGSTVRYLSNAATSVSHTPTYNNLIFNPVLTADRTYTMGGATTINGDFDIIPSGSANTLLVNLGGTTTLGPTKTVYVRRSGSNALSNLDAVNGANHAVSAGFVNIGTGGTYTARASTITLTGTSGTLLSNSGTFTQGTSTVTVTSASGTPALLGGLSSTTFSTLTLNSAATVINGGSSTFTVSGNMNVSQGVFNASEAITGPGASGTFTVSSGATFCLGGGITNTATTCDSEATSEGTIPMPTFQTYTFTGSTVRYLSNDNTTISSTPVYNNLIFNPILTGGRTYTFDGAVTINGDFTSNPTASSSYALTTALGGTTTVAAGKTISLTGTTSGTSTLDTMPGGSAYDLSAGYINIGTAGTLDAGGSTSTITLTGTSATPLFTLAGVFTAGSSTVVFSPDADVTLTSGAFTFNNLSLTPAISTAGRAYTFGSGTQTVNGDFLIQPSGTQLLTVNMAGSITVSNTKTTTITRSSTATSKLVPGASNPALSSGNITIATGGTLDGTSSSSTITLTANSTPFTVTGTYTPGSTTISYVPANTTGVTVASTTYYNVIFNKASNTFSLTTGGITVTNDLTITAGVLDAVNGSNYPITVGRNWTNTPGTSGFEAQQGTVTFNTTTTGTITGATTFYNFTSTAAGKTIKFNDSTTYRINGLLTLTGSAGPTYVTLDSVSGNPSWTINHQGTEAVTYTSVKNSACDGTSQDIDAYGANNYDAGGNGDCWLFTEPLTQVNFSFWKLDEGYGTTVNDSTDAGNTATLAGTTKPTWQNEEYCVVGKCLYFEGTTAKVTASQQVNTKTVSFWARPVSTTTTFLQLNNSAYISATAGTLASSGFTTPTFYVNGVQKTTIEAGKWQHIVVTTGTTVAGSVIILGNNSTNYYQGLMDEVRLDASEYTAGQVKGDFTRRGAPDPVGAQYGDDMSWISNGLVGYWRLDESSGNASDSSGNGNTLTDGSATTYASAKFGNGADLESSSTDYLYIADNATLSITGDLTISAWIKPESVTAATLFDIAGKFDGTPEAYQLSQYGDEIRLYVDSSSNYATTDAANLATGTWYHVTGVYNATTSSVRLYVNGVLQASTVTGTIPSSITDNTARFHIGAEDSTGGATNYYDGLVDDVRVYKRALSEYEARTLYTFSPSPIAHYKLDEGSGTTANDSTDNAYTGTLTNSPVWGVGKYGGGVTVNGTQQYISVADDANLRLSGNFSLEGWVRPQNTSKDYLLINNNTPLLQKIDGTDGYELGITQDGIPYGMLTDVSKTWTRYDNTGSADCSFSESYDDGCVFNLGTTNNWDDAQVYTPFVFKEGSTYKMYYGGNDGSKVSVGLATSTNGYSWTRNSGNNCSSTGDGCVLPYGGASSWNINASYFPSVIKDGSTYKMWFGGSDGTNVRIGYATSTNGANWTLYGSNNCTGTSGNGCIFDIGTSGNWDAKFVTAPSVIKDGSTYKMWYFGRDASNVDRIGYATSSDGITWTRNSGNNCSTSGDGCIVGLGGANTWYANFVSGPRVIKDGALYHMVFNGIKTGDDHYRLGYATSTDGVTWTKYDNTSSAACGYSESYDEGCILDAGSASSWDDRYLVYPTLLKDGPTMRIWYSGIRISGNYRIGYATFTPGITDTTAISGDTYHHLAFTKSGTSLSLYVDGALKTTGTTAVTTIANTSALLSGNSLYGSLDDLKIYNYARSQGEITRDMNANHPAPGSPVGSAIGHWKFDEGADNTCIGGSNDVCNAGSSGTTLDGTSTAARSNDGKFAGALNFDGTDDVVTITNSTGIDLNDGLASGFTLSAWIYADSDGEADTGQIVWKGGSTYLRVSGESGSNLNIDASLDLATSDATKSLTAPVTKSSWNHIVMSWTDDGDDEITLWVNGVNKGSSTDGSGAPAAESNNLLVGGTTTANFDGKIDEVKVYNFELTTDQVKVEYNQGKSQVLGSLSTASDGKTGDNSASRAYCPPGNLEGNCAAGQNPAPIVHYSFDEGSGTSAKDISGNSLTGTISGSAAYKSAKYGHGLEFGSGKYVTLTGEGSTLSSNTKTITAWVYRTIDSGFDEYLIDNQDGSGDGWFMFIGSLDKLECYYNNAQSLSSDSLAIGRWYHVACTTDGSTQKLYLDGVQVDSDSITGSISESNDARIGARSYTSPSGYLNAIVDDFRIYPYVRTQAQIAWDYNRGAPMGHWKFDECGGTAIHSSNEVYNTALNGSWSGSGGGTQTSLGDCETVGSAWYNGQSGKYNGSLNFDGTDDYVSFGDLSILDNSTQASISLWFKTSSNPTDQRILLDKGNSLRIEFNNSSLQILTGDGSSWVLSNGEVTYANSLLSTSTWHHVVLKFDGQVSSLFVDGIVVDSITDTSFNLGNNSNIYSIGDYGAVHGTYNFSGQIDDIRIYNYALSEAQIKTVYNGGQAVNLR